MTPEKVADWLSLLPTVRTQPPRATWPDPESELICWLAPRLNVALVGEREAGETAQGGDVVGLKRAAGDIHCRALHEARGRGGEEAARRRRTWSASCAVPPSLTRPNVSVASRCRYRPR